MTDSIPWTAKDTTTDLGRLGMVLCWYFDGDIMGVKEDCQTVARLVRELPSILRGHFKKQMDWDIFCLSDALGSYPERDATMEAIYQKLDAERHRRIQDEKNGCIDD